MPNPRTEQAVQALRQEGWRPLREALGALPEGSRISEHTFLKSWRTSHLVPRSIEPRVFTGYGVHGHRGGAVALWPPEISRFVRAARELQAYVYVRMRLPRQRRLEVRGRLRRVRACASLRVALWALGYNYDRELIRDTLIQQLIEFGQLVTRRGQQMFQSRGAATSDTPSKSDKEMLEDLIDAHGVRLTRAEVKPRVALQELGTLLIGRGRSGSLMPRLIDDIRGATALDLEHVRSQARALLLCYVSWESLRRGAVHALEETNPRSQPAELREAIQSLQEEYGQLDSAWRHLMLFPVVAAYLVHVAHSTDRRLIQWREHVLSEYGQWTLWEALPPSLREAAGQ